MATFFNQGTRLLVNQVAGKAANDRLSGQAVTRCMALLCKTYRQGSRLSALSA